MTRSRPSTVGDLTGSQTFARSLRRANSGMSARPSRWRSTPTRFRGRSGARRNGSGRWYSVPGRPSRRPRRRRLRPVRGVVRGVDARSPRLDSPRRGLLYLVRCGTRGGSPRGRPVVGGRRAGRRVAVRALVDVPVLDDHRADARGRPVQPHDALPVLLLGMAGADQRPRAAPGRSRSLTVADHSPLARPVRGVVRGVDARSPLRDRSRRGLLYLVEGGTRGGTRTPNLRFWRPLL